MMRPLQIRRRESISSGLTWEKQWKDRQLDLGSSSVVALGGIEHVDSILESELDDVFGRTFTDLVPNGEP